MDLFTMLEAKINQMILFAVNLKKENAELKTFVEKLKVENEGLKTENATVVRDNAQLSAQIRSIELSMERGSEQISVLNEEKTLAKIVVDDLIKSIDALVEREDQQ